MNYAEVSLAGDRGPVPGRRPHWASTSLYTAYVDVLAARQTVRYAQVSAGGSTSIAESHRGAVPEGRTSARRRRGPGPVRERRRPGRPGGCRGEPPSAETGPGGPAQSAAGAGRPARGCAGPWKTAAPPPPADELVRMALECRPDVAAYPTGRPDAAQAASSWPWPTASQTPTCSTSRSRSRTTPRSAREARRPGRWGSPSPCRSTTATRGTSSGPEINVLQSQIELATGNGRSSRRCSRRSRRVRGQRPDRRQHPRPDPAGLRGRSPPRTALPGRARSTCSLSRISSGPSTTGRKPTSTPLVRHRKAMLTVNTVVGQRLLP